MADAEETGAVGAAAALESPASATAEVIVSEHTPALREVFALLDKGDGTVPTSELSE